MRVVFLCSGGGGNFRFVRRCVESGLLEDVEIAGVVADRECGALESARRASITAVHVAYERSDPRALSAALEELSPDRIVSTFDRILDHATVASFEGRIVNLHYSLLPAFGGLTGDAPVRRALDSGCRILGTTVHEVVEAVDAGPILAQSALSARDGEPVETTVGRVFRSGAVNLGGVLDRIARNAATPAGGWSYRADVDSFFSPAAEFAEGAFGTAFWMELS